MDKSKTELSSIRLYGRLLSYVLPYIPLFLISILGFAVYSGSQVAATEWLKRVIDYVNNPEGDLRLVLPMALIAIAFVRGIGFFVGNYLLSSISNRLVHNLRTELFEKLTVLLRLTAKRRNTQNDEHNGQQSIHILDDTMAALTVQFSSRWSRIESRR